MDLRWLLQEAVGRQASDLHVVVGIPPTIRVHGELKMLYQERLSPVQARDFVYSVMTPAQRERFEKNLELNFSLTLPSGDRFRGNVYIARGNVEGAFRLIALKPHTLQELGVPRVAQELSRRSSGLVLLTGPAGQGKTTTMAAIIDFINQERRCRIITIEDPTEYLHQNANSIVIQREVGGDTKSFNTALIHSLRQDPDVICIGEMRDLETISTALTAAETGHLVLATLHTPEEPQCIDRIVDVFPPMQQDQVRVQLSSVLEGVIAHRLLARVDAQGRVLVAEVLVSNAAVRSLIRDNRTDQLYTVMETGSAEGMVSRDRALRDLVQRKVIKAEVALLYARHPQHLKAVLGIA